jgi:hypothetical protein
MIKRPSAVYLICSLFMLFETACDGQSAKYASTSGYNLEKPEVVTLPKEINQISGIAYYEADNSVFAIDDDHGNLYEISLEAPDRIKHWQFGKDKDYEDLVYLTDRFYILNSHGSVVTFPFTFPIGETSKESLVLQGSNEFEILYAQPAKNRLIMMCKKCEADEKEVSAYSYRLADKSFDPQPVLTLKKKEIEKVLGEKIERFKPSGASINPQTGEVFIISSINKLLIIADESLTVRNAVKLNPSIFNQPEGLCFTSKGDLLISNEAGTKGTATLLLFKKDR